MAFVPVNFTPGAVPARELPVQMWSEWQSVGQVKSAVKSMELGIFDAASQVVDAMGRDDRISGCLLTRCGALPSLPITFEPRGDGRQKKAVAADVEETFEQMCPDHALTELMHWGVMLGIGLAQNIWQMESGRWEPRLKVWHPRFLSWRWDTRSLWVSAMEGQIEVNPGDGQWVLYAPYGLQRGWMHGKVRSLYVPWLIRQWGLRDFARYSEVHGMPIRKAKLPAGAEDEDKERFVKQVANLGQESIIRTPFAQGANSEWERYDIELVEAMGRSEETFEKLLDMANTNVAIALLGQNLTTEVKGGSYAATMGHLQIHNSVLQSDSETLGPAIREQVLGPFCQVNYGSSKLAPMPCWKTKPPDDQVQKGQALKNLGEGALALKKVGVKVDLDKLAESAEIPTTGKAEDIDVNALPAPAGPGAPGGGGGAPGPNQKLPRPVARASRIDGEELPDATVEGQLYADDLTANGTKAGRKALGKDLAAVLEVIAQAKTYEEASEALRRTYTKMSRKDLAKVLKNAILMAEFAGRHAVKEENKEDVG